MLISDFDVFLRCAAAEGEAPPSPGPRQELLQRRIQQTSTAFLKTHVFGLDKLPDHEHLQQLQETRRLVKTSLPLLQ